jgi:hypothetical protein
MKTRLRAFGLAEVMISASMLAVGIAAMCSVFRTLEVQYEHERNVTEALHLAEGQMETLLAAYADTLDASSTPLLGDGAHTSATSYDHDGKPGGSYFAVGWNVTSGVPIANTRSVTVTVSWTEAGRPKSFSLTTVRT